MFYVLSGLYLIAAIVIASVLTCGCCHAGNYKSKPHVKKWAKATLGMLCLALIFHIVGLFLIGLIPNLLALVFYGLITWGRGCGAPQALG
jgi:hypothetical protein